MARQRFYVETTTNSPNRFLLDPMSGPFTTSLSAHRSIAYACISHLIQALDFVAMPAEVMTTRVGLGICGIHTYATEYWIEHFLDSVAKDSIHLPSDTLVRQVQRLALKHSELSRHDVRASLNHVDSGFAKSVDSRLQLVDSLIPVQALMAILLAFRKRPKCQQPLGGPDTPTPQDTTLFSVINDEYHNAVLFLLRTNAHPGLSPAELHKFRSDYGQTAFVMFDLAIEPALDMLLKGNSRTTKIGSTATA